MVEDHSAQKLRLENWMADLPEPIKDMPLIFLAIPGNFFNLLRLRNILYLLIIIAVENCLP